MTETNQARSGTDKTSLTKYASVHRMDCQNHRKENLVQQPVELDHEKRVCVRVCVCVSAWRREDRSRRGAAKRIIVWLVIVGFYSPDRNCRNRFISVWKTIKKKSSNGRLKHFTKSGKCESCFFHPPHPFPTSPRTYFLLCSSSFWAFVQLFLLSSSWLFNGLSNLFNFPLSPAPCDSCCLFSISFSVDLTQTVCLEGNRPSNLSSDSTDDFYRHFPAEL